jgi:diadenylate cyclase
VERLSRSATGAIIAVEREVRLDPYLESGTVIRAGVSAELLASIFSRYSPLHDGAVLVRGDEIVGAGCILPLTQNLVGDRSLGTRHRAALGLSEETDALVLVVSEESAIVSLARGGALERGLSPDQVAAAIVGRRP